MDLPGWWLSLAFRQAAATSRAEGALAWCCRQHRLCRFISVRQHSAAAPSPSAREWSGGEDLWGSSGTQQVLLTILLTACNPTQTSVRLQGQPWVLCRRRGQGCARDAASCQAQLGMACHSFDVDMGTVALRGCFSAGQPWDSQPERGSSCSGQQAEEVNFLQSSKTSFLKYLPMRGVSSRSAEAETEECEKQG